VERVVVQRPSGRRTAGLSLGLLAGAALGWLAGLLRVPKDGRR
jgi:gas vesicle protein